MAGQLVLLNDVIWRRDIIISLDKWHDTFDGFCTFMYFIQWWNILESWSLLHNLLHFLQMVIFFCVCDKKEGAT